MRVRAQRGVICTRSWPCARPFKRPFMRHQSSACWPTSRAKYGRGRTERVQREKHIFWVTSPGKCHQFPIISGRNGTRCDTRTHIVTTKTCFLARAARTKNPCGSRRFFWARREKCIFVRRGSGDKTLQTQSTGTWFSPPDWKTCSSIRLSKSISKISSAWFIIL